MRLNTKSVFRIISISLFLLLLAEGILRFLGFGSIPLFMEDPDYEYIFAPDQDIHRLGRHFYINHFSMRSDALAIDDGIRILFFGDSILNGGLPTDNDDLATSILEQNLSIKLKKKIRALNISASGWGPDNAAAYLKKNGNFGAKMIVLIFSSHDYFDNMGFEREVGVNSAFPSKNPFCAITDFVFVYLIPLIEHRISPPDNKKKDTMYYQNSEHMNSGWGFFIDYAQKNHLPLLVYLHSDKEEASKGYYNQYGIRLTDFFENAKVPCIQEVNLKPNQKFYRDFIHFNKEGQLFMADKLETALIKSLGNQPTK